MCIRDRVVDDELCLFETQLAVFVQQAFVHIAGCHFGKEQVVACLLYTSAGCNEQRIDHADGAGKVVALHEIPDAHGERDARRQDHHRTDNRMTGRCAQHSAGQNALQRDERRTADLAKAAGQLVLLTQQQIAAGKKACQCRRQRTAQCAACLLYTSRCV